MYVSGTSGWCFLSGMVAASAPTLRSALNSDRTFGHHLQTGRTVCGDELDVVFLGDGRHGIESGRLYCIQLQVEQVELLLLFWTKVTKARDACHGGHWPRARAPRRLGHDQGHNSSLEANYAYGLITCDFHRSCRPRANIVHLHRASCIMPN